MLQIGSDNIKPMAQKAMSLCRDMATPSELMEALMVKSHSEVSNQDIMEAINMVAPLYKKMIELYNDMVQLLKKKASSSTTGQAIKLKPLTL